MKKLLAILIFSSSLFAQSWPPLTNFTYYWNPAAGDTVTFTKWSRNNDSVRAGTARIINEVNRNIVHFNQGTANHDSVIHYVMIDTIRSNPDIDSIHGGVVFDTIFPDYINATSQMVDTLTVVDVLNADSIVTPSLNISGTIGADSIRVTNNISFENSINLPCSLKTLGDSLIDVGVAYRNNMGKLTFITISGIGGNLSSNAYTTLKVVMPGILSAPRGDNINSATTVYSGSAWVLCKIYTTDLECIEVSPATGNFTGMYSLSIDFMYTKF